MSTVRAVRARLADRARKARAAVAFAVVLTRVNGRPETVLVPGSKGKQYRVALTRKAKAIYTGCELWSSPQPEDEKYCRGNTRTVCYHSIQAIEVALAEQGFRGRWCADEASANFQAKMVGGHMIEVRSGDNVEAIPLYLAVGEA